MLALVVASGCYAPPELPDDVDGVPIGDACAAPRQAEVERVLDGDTVDLVGGERVRLLGIDAPEIAHDAPAECWGDAAGGALRDLVEGRAVGLSFDVACRDVYGRTLAYAWILGENDTASGGGDLLVNEWMLAAGNARLYDEPWVDPLRLQPRLDDAEARARTLGLGLWGACGT